MACDLLLSISLITMKARICFYGGLLEFLATRRITDQNDSCITGTCQLALGLLANLCLS